MGGTLCKTKNINTVYVNIILQLLFLDTCKLFVKETPLNSLRLTYTLHYIHLDCSYLGHIVGSLNCLVNCLVGSPTGPEGSPTGPVGSPTIPVPNCSSRVTNWSSRVPKWSAESPNGLVGSQNGPVEFLNGPAGSLNNLVGSPNGLDLVGSTNGLDGSLIYLI